MKLKIIEKIACSIGGMISAFHIQMIQMFLLFYYSDVIKIPAGFVATLFLAVRLLNAFCGPFIGLIIDRIRLPWGKYRSWIILISVPTGIFGWLTFTSVNLDTVHKMIYISITYFLYNIVMTISQIATAGLIPAVTKNLHDRISLGMYTFMFILAGSMAVSICVPPLYKILGGGSDAAGLSRLMGIFFIIGVVVAVFQVMNINERYVTDRPKNEIVNTKDILKMILKTKTALIVYVNTFSSQLAHSLRVAITIIFFKYYFNNESLVMIMGMASTIPIAIGVLFSARVTKRIGMKKNLTISAVLQSISMFIIFFIPSNTVGIVIYFVSSVIAGLFGGFAYPSQGLLLPAVMDYIELKSGKNLSAFMGSINGLMSNIGIALSGAIAAGALSFAGYVPSAVQSESTILVIRMSMSIIPGLFLLPTLCLFFFDLTEEKQNEIGKKLIQKRESLTLKSSNFS